MRTTRTEHLRVTEGRNIRFGMDKETPVFDKAEAQSRNPVVQIGLDGNAGPSLPFRRSDADARPFKVVPFHEPDPDRIAKAEALRLRLAAQDEERLTRYAQIGPQETKPASWARPKRIPVVLNPDTSECCAPEVAVVKAERGTRTLYWRSLRDAEAAFGAPPGKRRIEPSLVPSNPMSDPYGWRWTRLADARRDNGGQNKGVRA